MQKIKLTLIALVVVFSLFAGISLQTSAPALAATAVASTAAPGSASKQTACNSLAQLDASQKCSTKGAGITNAIKNIVVVMSFFAGALAVIMVIASGIKYVTSGGDPNKVASAKNTLVYALVGVVIAVLAQTIVHFVLNTI